MLVAMLQLVEVQMLDAKQAALSLAWAACASSLTRHLPRSHTNGSMLELDKDPMTPSPGSHDFNIYVYIFHHVKHHTIQILCYMI